MTDLKNSFNSDTLNYSHVVVAAFLIGVVVFCILCMKNCSGKNNLTPEKDKENSYAEMLSHKGDLAWDYVNEHHLDTEFCLLIDYSLPSGTPRVFVWSFKEKKVVFTAHTMHGPGMGSTAEIPVFSNEAGSLCSALGNFAITKEHGRINTLGFRLKGLDVENSNAYERALMLHDAYHVDAYVAENCKYIPLSATICSGVLLLRHMS